MTDEHSCPGDELLIGYLEGALDRDRARVEDHLARCDDCVATLCCIHARLQATARRLEAPPAAVSMRARAALGQPATHVDRRVPVVLRLPILVPAGLAAGFLLVVATHTWLMPAPAGIVTRAAQMQRATQVTPVRAQPSASAAVLGDVHAGEMVEVRGRQAGWCRIGRAERGEGWIDCGVLE